MSEQPLELLFIPQPGTQAHASSLLVVSETLFLVSWFAGSHEGAFDSTIHVLRVDGDQRILSSIFEDDDLPHWNPVLSVGPDGDVCLFFKRRWRIDEWTTWMCRSHDGGLSWSEPLELVTGDDTGGRGPVRQAPVLVGDLWMAAGSVEKWDPALWDCFVDISPDRGQSWESVPIPLNHHGIRGAGCIQPCLVVLPDQGLVALTRSTAGTVFRSATRNPFDWPELRPVQLPNSNSGIAAVALPDGRIVVCHNLGSADWGPRSSLVLSYSGDEGVTWSTERVIVGASEQQQENIPDGADGRPQGAAVTGVITSGADEFSYPSMVVVGPELWVTYTWQRRSIAMAKIAW